MIDNGIDVAIRTREHEPDSAITIRRLASTSRILAGLGVLVQPAYIVYEDIVAGRLVPVLLDWDLPRLQINIAYTRRKHLSAKVRSFIDFLVDEFKAHDCERKWTGVEARGGVEPP